MYIYTQSRNISVSKKLVQQASVWNQNILKKHLGCEKRIVQITEQSKA